jgi:hypothetical protein
MKKILSFALILFALVSCSTKPKYEVAVNIEDNDSLINKKMIVIQRIDNAIKYSDTIKIKKHSFKLNIPYDGPALLFISVPDSKLQDVIIAAEEGSVSLNIKGGKTLISGTPLNDRLQTFYNASDSVSQLFAQLDEKFVELQNDSVFASEMATQYMLDRRRLIKENTDRIIAFTKENIDNPIGEFYFVNNYFMYSEERKMEMNLFMTDRIKKLLGFIE